MLLKCLLILNFNYIVVNAAHIKDKKDLKDQKDSQSTQDYNPLGALVR